jgi:hypothetical protein
MKSTFWFIAWAFLASVSWHKEPYIALFAIYMSIVAVTGKTRLF